jgi:putative DNA primase/helicase
MHFDPEAQQLFDAWESAHNQKIDQERNTGKQSHLSKYKGALPKLAALLQLVDLAALNGTIQGHLLISKGHLQKAIGLLNYLEAHMHRVYDSKRDSLSHVEYLLAERMKNGQFRNGSSAREIARRCWVGLQKVEHVEGALENLSGRGWVRIMPATNEPGRPTTRWEVNPAVRGMD